MLGPKALFFLIALVYTGFLSYLSLINLAETPVKDLGISDKIMHAGAYFLLVFLWVIFYVFNYPAESLNKRISFICLGSIGFGIFIEVLQKELTTYRELDIFDIVANTVGVMSAGIVVWLLKGILIRLKPKINSFFLKKYLF